MEAVKSFSDELFSVQETKGPISRAKMAKITSIAIKAVKFYKHVVHNVEKFIQRSDSDHKIPGLYVMDSIIRQSIHRFGPEKDVFASRFAKNIFGTFQHLLQCKEDEKVKIVRVLQLWQKNAVFDNDLIQKLLDIIQKSSEESTQLPDEHVADMPVETNDNENVMEANAQSDSSKILNNVCQMLQSDKAMQINQLLQQVASNHPQLLPQLSQIIQLSQNQTSQQTSAHQPAVDLDIPDSSNSHFHASTSAFGNARESNWPKEDVNNESYATEPSRMQSWLSESLRVQQTSGNTGSGTFGSSHPHRPNDTLDREEGEMWEEEDLNHYHSAPGNFREFYNNNDTLRWGDASYEDKNYTRKRRRSLDRRSNDRSQRSRSREKRRRSRSRERSFRSDSRERQRREADRNRRHLGLPAMEPNHAQICSTTLWIGHLNKHTTEHELRMELSNHGSISSLNLIPPRGCAFVTFSTRKEAQKALDRMKGKKFNNYVLKLAWAIGSGMKESEFKEFWSLEQGTSHIPWDRLDDSVDLDALAEGGFLDEDSLPQELLKALAERRQSVPVEEVPLDCSGQTQTENPEVKPNLGPVPMVPPCFPMSHMPPPLPGMPPLLPPPPGMMVHMPPPPIIPSGAPAPMAMLSPNQVGNNNNMTEGLLTPTSSGTPGNPSMDVRLPHPSFPPPPMAGWTPQGMRALPPPISFPPPPVRPLGPSQNVVQSSDELNEVNPSEGLDPQNETEFNNSGLHGQPQTPFRGQLRPPLMSSPGPWGFNKGQRGTPRFQHHPRDEEFYRDGGHSFTPNRFNPRFRSDQRSRGNWGGTRGNFRRNFRQWNEKDGEEQQREELQSDGERYHGEQNRNVEYWNRDQRGRRPDQRWSYRRNDRWGAEEQGGSGGGGGGGGGGFQRGRARWNEAHQERDHQRWNRGRHGNHWEDQRHQQHPHHHHHHHQAYHQEERDFKAQERYDEMAPMSSEVGENQNWMEHEDGTKMGTEESVTASQRFKDDEEGGSGAPQSISMETHEETGRKRTKKSRWDTESDRSFPVGPEVADVGNA